MTKEQAREFKDRWRLANERINQEILKTPPEVKLKQLAALFEAVKYFDWSVSSLHEDYQARERWRILREIYAKPG